MLKGLYIGYYSASSDRQKKHSYLHGICEKEVVI